MTSSNMSNLRPLSLFCIFWGMGSNKMESNEEYMTKIYLIPVHTAAQQPWPLKAYGPGH